MGKINLSMPVGKWLSMHIRKGTMGWTEFKVAVFGGFDDFSMRLLCESTKSEMLQVSDLGEKVLTAYSDALKEAGLRFGMTDEELDAYQRENEAGHRAKPAPKADNIDWEQRRWELVKELFAQAKSEYKWLQPKPQDIIERADKLLEEYKKSLNTEEWLWKHYYQY